MNTSSNETGVIKFNCNWIQDQAVDFKVIAEINHWRDLLFALGLIGVYPNGIGYGNLSIRLSGHHFLISGSATGHLKQLNTNHYSTVTGYDLAQNSITCVGPIQASSESLTHATIYEMDPSVNAVVHVHHPALWNALFDKVPTSSKDVEYGIPEMALETKRLFNATNLREQKIMVMGGHPEGIVSFGANLDEAGELIIKYLKSI